MKPRNCNECKHTNNCNSAFGGLGCKHKEEIELDDKDYFEND